MIFWPPRIKSDTNSFVFVFSMSPNPDQPSEQRRLPVHLPRTSLRWLPVRSHRPAPRRDELHWLKQRTDASSVFPPKVFDCAFISLIPLIFSKFSYFFLGGENQYNHLSSVFITMYFFRMSPFLLKTLITFQFYNYNWFILSNQIKKHESEGKWEKYLYISYFGY